jgi:hypothetical protein
MEPKRSRAPVSSGCENGCYHRPRQVAKKARTPAPPRKIQAPQRRVDPRRRRTPDQRRTILISVAFAAVGIAAVAAVAVAFAVTGGNGSSSSGTTPTISNTAGLVGIQTGPAPWNPGLDHLTDRLGPLGLQELGAEGEVIHIHQHLDVFVNGKHEPVPANIGIYDGQYLTELHTHDESGVMHVESPTKREFNLGQFFGVWGVRMNSKCIGGYCKPETPWRVYVNGLNWPGDPATLPLKKHQEIAIVIGTKRPKTIPSTFEFGGL